MNELTIEEKLEEAKMLYKDANADQRYVLESLFPELAEIEDLRIRKALINGFNKLDKSALWYNGITNGQILAWLEKQNSNVYNANKEYWRGYCEGKQVILDKYAELEKQGENSIYNVPSREVILAIWDLGNEWKELTNGSISTEYGTQLAYIQKHWEEGEHYLREKQGNTQKEASYTYEAETGNGNIKALVTEEVQLPKFKVGDEIKTDNEESLTITKIDEKGYWSNDLFICGFDDAAKWELVEQKPVEWNEEDETMITDLSVIVHTYFSEISGIPFKYDLSEDKIRIWLDSLKDRVQPKQKWSEEDEKCIRLSTDILDSALRAGFCVQIDRDRCVDWLKSLRPQNRWKSSEEQIDVLDKVIRNPHLSTTEYNGLIVLKEQLKAL